MRDAGIGRVLVASLHQGIADILPTRLDFYESWLTAEGLRDGTIGLAPLFGVLSFLRQEGDAYQVITSHAGRYGAEWTVEAMSPLKLSFIKSMPHWLRVRMVLRLARKLVPATYRDSRAVSRLHRRTARVDIRASIFCTVREPVPHALCGFYAAAFGRLFELFGMSARVEVVSCRGTGGGACVVKVAVAGPDGTPAEAA